MVSVSWTFVQVDSSHSYRKFKSGLFLQHKRCANNGLFNEQEIFLVDVFPVQPRSRTKIINKSSHGCHLHFVPIAN